MFNFMVYRKMSTITDGTSNSAAISEVISGSSGTVDHRGLWWDTWGDAYTHGRAPNSNVPDSVWSAVQTTFCSDLTVPAKPKQNAPCNGSGTSWNNEAYAARSYHPGGVNVGMADGSVRFVINAISTGTWLAMGSLDGGEVLGSDAN